jgi:enoyl-CoA hydratase/carnithine racemase
MAAGVHRLAVPSGPLTLAAAGALERAARALAENRDARVVVLEGDAAGFAPAVAEGWSPLGSGLDVAAAVAAIRCPTVALLRGPVHSVGLEIALACDLRVAGDDVTYAFPELAVGRLPCWGGTQRLPRVAGLPAAMVLLLGETLEAGDPLAAGLAQYRVPGDALDATADALVSTLLGLAPLALELVKEAVHRGGELPMRRGLELEGDLNHLLQSTGDRAEGLAAFAEKRAPAFEGR